MILPAIAIALGPSGASAGDADAGRRLAETWCSSCHVVGRSAQGSDVAPPFPTIARRYGHDRAWLSSWLAASHPPMPDFNLERNAIDDLTAYLESLPRD